MYMQEALEAVCKKRKLKPNEYALLVRDMSILIPLDRTVASLEGKSDLVLVMRSSLPRYGIVDTGRSMRTTDPNGKSPEGSFSLFREGLTRLLILPSFFTASIFKRMSETPGEQNSVTDYTGAYKVQLSLRTLRVPISIFHAEICDYQEVADACGKTREDSGNRRSLPSRTYPSQTLNTNADH